MWWSSTCRYYSTGTWYKDKQRQRYLLSVKLNKILFNHYIDINNKYFSNVLLKRLCLYKILYCSNQKTISIAINYYPFLACLWYNFALFLSFDIFSFSGFRVQYFWPIYQANYVCILFRQMCLWYIQLNRYCHQIYY